MITAHKQTLITYKAQLRFQEMLERWSKEYYGSRLEAQNGIYGEEGRHMAINSQVPQSELPNATGGEPVNQVPNAGDYDTNAINPADLV